LVDVQNSGAQGIVNIDKTEFSGIEFEIVGRLSETVLISAGATIVDSEITEFSEAPQYIGNNSPYAPELTWVVAIDYAPSINEKWDLSVHADYSGQSGMYYEYFGSIEQPSFGLLNCRVALVRDNFRIEAWGENLSDERYYTDVASNNVTGGLGDLGIRGRGIRYGINLTFEY
jgi:outer membrane receptor protein involved in Fe transport